MKFAQVYVISLFFLIQSYGEEKISSDISRSVESGLRIVQKGAGNYPKNRDCFSCHHQTLPMLAMREASQAGIQIDEELMSDQVQFINCLLYTSPSPRDLSTSRMPSSA